MITNNTLLVPRIESRIQVIRGLRIPLDVDLAALYGVQTKRLNEQVKRNRDRFASDFLFQLTADEKTEVVANCDHLRNLKSSNASPLRLLSTVPSKRPIGFLTHVDKKRPNASALTNGRKAPAASNQRH
jgi:hypothetical protein